MADLRDPRLMCVKAVLFVGIGAIGAALLLLESRTARTAALLALTVWAFCRAYYFAFYVIERYIDPRFRFDGLWSAARFMAVQRRKESGERPAGRSPD
ncbi:hypothetical protein Pla123a_00390 [Posidoniimonas polymericola]|uniref:Uncharacterized protein n=1 Tax=Posidoniimonas polymericola TaxID=2528002 RepID=A0A5C5ZFA2_9BACT|nr:hypothetical protein [Posidoniimonas polymericola]TWT85233.1 hypothetical protein Pla123a_00390 [Posidoniimonas polymericola]